MGTVSHQCVASCELHDHLWLKMPFHICYIYIAFPQCVPVDALQDDYAVKKPYHIDYNDMVLPHYQYYLELVNEGIPMFICLNNFCLNNQQNQCLSHR